MNKFNRFNILGIEHGQLNRAFVCGKSDEAMVFGQERRNEIQILLLISRPLSGV